MSSICAKTEWCHIDLMIHDHNHCMNCDRTIDKIEDTCIVNCYVKLNDSYDYLEKYLTIQDEGDYIECDKTSCDVIYCDCYQQEHTRLCPCGDLDCGGSPCSPSICLIGSNTHSSKYGNSYYVDYDFINVDFNHLHSSKSPKEYVCLQCHEFIVKYFEQYNEYPSEEQYLIYIGNRHIDFKLKGG